MIYKPKVLSFKLLRYEVKLSFELLKRGLMKYKFSITE